MKTLLRIALIVVAVASGWADAQTLSGVGVNPTTVAPGQPVTITASFANADNPNCNVRVHFGDGKTQDFKINQAKDVPLIVTRSYAKAGEYKVMVEPKTALPVLKCLGDNQVAQVQVAAPQVAKAAAIACPDGWTLDGKSVHRKSGAYTCRAKPGTPLPAVKPECAAPLGYFENKSRGQLGCKP